MDLVVIRKVWDYNFNDEMLSLSLALENYRVAAIDTEFPGFVAKAARDASESERYVSMKYNVDNMKLIQLGLTLSDEYGNIGGCWEFNFRDFDCHRDLCDASSIEFLKKNGIDFEEMNKRGIYLERFKWSFVNLLSKHHRNMKWVVFHGLYDFAYLYRLLTGGLLPESPDQFAQRIGRMFGFILDLKFIAGCSPKLAGIELGLEKLSKNLNVERLGGAHHAGSDSLLTACVFLEMIDEFRFKEVDFQGRLYGLSFRASRMVVIVRHPVPVFIRRPVCFPRALIPGPCTVFLPCAPLHGNAYIA